MSPTRFQRLKAEFNSLLDLDVEARESRLALIADADAELASELRRLLAAVDERDLSSEPTEGDMLIGQRVGPFELTRLLGAGGMGVVYLGERVDGEVLQQVAIKLPGRLALVDSQSSRAARERDLLARLSHPHIAGLIDAGNSPTLGPWFAMEYVAGTPITRFADEAKLDVHARLALWLQVTEAVAYAHRHAIVHRDIKPGNVLVDADGRARLLDFGIAKFLDSDAAVTATAVAFTARYASPEQVAGEPASTATDVHGLGLLLHELLCGCPAFVAESDLALRQAIATADPPSLRAALAAQAAATGGRIAEARQTTIEALSRVFDSDLEAVVGKALRKQPSERYGSVGELAADVRAWLSGRPVSAMPPSVSYRLRKFIGRHRAVAAGIALASLGVAVGIAVALHQRADAVQARRQAQAENEVLLEILRGADPYHARGPDLKLGDMLGAATETIARRTDLEPLLQARLLLSLGTSSYFMSLNDQALVALEASHKALAAVADPPDALQFELRLRDLGLRSGTAGTDEALAEALSLEPEAARIGGDLEVEYWEVRSMLHASLRDYRKALEMLDRADAHAGPPRTRGEFRRQVSIELKRVNLLQFDQRIDEALEISDRVTKLAEAMPDDVALRVAVGTSRTDLLLTAGRPEEAASLIVDLADIARSYFGGRGFRYGRFELTRARALRKVGRLRDALAASTLGVAAYRESLPKSMFLADALDRHGALNAKLDEFEAAAEALGEAAVIYTGTEGGDASLTRSAAQRARCYEAFATGNTDAIAAALAIGEELASLPVGVALITARVAVDNDHEDLARNLLVAIGSREAPLLADELAQVAWLESRLARGRGDRAAAIEALARMDTAIADSSEPHELRARADTERAYWAEPSDRCAAVAKGRAAWASIDASGRAWEKQAVDRAGCER
jgi:serine/threonine-protein kinase